MLFCFLISSSPFLYNTHTCHIFFFKFQAKLLKVKLLLAAKDYAGVISEAGYILKEDEDNLQALLLRGRAYYYLADHDVATRFFFFFFFFSLFKIKNR